jgi:hypothetical protein
MERRDMVTFEQVYKLAEQLSVDEQMDLAEKLRSKLPRKFTGQVTREMLLAEHERLKAVGAFDNVESLYGKYANPESDVSSEDLLATIREIRDQWKEDFPELNDD